MRGWKRRGRDSGRRMGGRAERGSNKDGHETKNGSDAYGSLTVCVCVCEERQKGRGEQTEKHTETEVQREEIST